MRDQELIQAIRLVIRGLVQGVGFRPFLYRFADQLGLKGTIQNLGDFVEAVLEGPAGSLQYFVNEFQSHAPVLSQIESVEQFSEKVRSRAVLEIIESSGHAYDFSIPVDLATCSECQKEYLDPSNRRYLYPLLSCTQCGPRYSTVKRLPYDRINTTFSPFRLCACCQQEYQSISDRRFHAETTVCAQCGPQISLIPSDSKLVQDIIEIEREIHRRLKEGQILGVKGTGGFQWVVDATHRGAIETLRRRKQRPHQSLAVMARDLSCVRKWCELSAEDEALLQSPMAPILILKRKKDSQMDLLAPDTSTLGVMLPTTPLHQLLFGVKFPQAFDFLIVTSGNARDEPIYLSESEALQSQPQIADGFLTHNREIKRRCDDSVFISSGSAHQVWRMGRGFAPRKWIRPHQNSKTILALGADLKNTVSLAFQNRVMVSPHIGNLFHYETYSYFKENVDQFCELLNQKPEIIAVDLHPQYASSIFGRKFAEERQLSCVEVQHHHAHAVSCMLDHQLIEALALVFDGTGFGTDGTIWGGELLAVTFKDFRRLGRFRPAMIPGGESAILHPWKQGFARLFEAGIDVAHSPEWLEIFGIEKREAKIFQQLCQQGLNSYLTSSAGRLCDSVAAILGILGCAQKEISYEGQAAIVLEKWAFEGGFLEQEFRPYPYARVIPEGGVCSSGMMEIDFRETFHAIIDERVRQVNPRQIACRFHETLLAVACDLIEYGVEQTGLQNVVLSGGVFQNQLLARKLPQKLSQKLLLDTRLQARSLAQNIRIFQHRDIPPNDGGISLGQAVIASAKS